MVIKNKQCGTTRGRSTKIHSLDLCKIWVGGIITIIVFKLMTYHWMTPLLVAPACSSFQLGQPPPKQSWAPTFRNAPTAPGHTKLPSAWNSANPVQFWDKATRGFLSSIERCGKVVDRGAEGPLHNPSTLYGTSPGTSAVGTLWEVAQR